MSILALLLTGWTMLSDSQGLRKNGLSTMVYGFSLPCFPNAKNQTRKNIKERGDEHEDFLRKDEKHLHGRFWFPASFMYFLD